MSKFNSNVANKSAFLNLFTYLDYQGEDLDNLTIKNALKTIKKDHMGEVPEEEFKTLEKVANSNSEIGNMKIVSQSHCDHTKGMFNNTGSKCINDSIQSCAFKDSNGDLYVAYRGTGNGRWSDNGEGFTDASTDMQESARKYFDHVIDNNYTGGNLYVTGHSKGGNEAQYVTMTSKNHDKITACYNMDGQGFSEAAIANFMKKPYYEENLNKMFSIVHSADPVHDLINPIIPEENTYYTNTHYKDSNKKTNISYCHDILGMGLFAKSGIDWQRDEYGIVINGEEGMVSKVAKEFNKTVNGFPEEEKRSIALSVMEVVDIFSNGESMDGAGPSMKQRFLGWGGLAFVLSGKADDFNEYCEELGKFIDNPSISMKEKIKFALKTSLFLDFCTIISPGMGLDYETSKKFLRSSKNYINKVINKFKGKENWFDVSMNILSSSLVSMDKKLSNYIYRHTNAGYKQAINEPYINIDTDAMSRYSIEVFKEKEMIDEAVEGLRQAMSSEEISEFDIQELADIRRELMNCSEDLQCCANYLSDTANEFVDLENRLANL